MWVYAAGVPNAKEMIMTQTNETTTAHDDIDAADLLSTLRIEKVQRRSRRGWVKGTIGGHRFDARVFPEHAAIGEFELDDSRISKLWVQRLEDRATVANFDRGWDIEPATPIAERIVEMLSAGLADFVWDQPVE
jgi:hypothetical protein